MFITLHDGQVSHTRRGIGARSRIIRDARCSRCMPKGTKVDKIYEALKKEGMDKGKAARIAQSKSGEALATGKPPKQRKK